MAEDRSDHRGRASELHPPEGAGDTGDVCGSPSLRNPASPEARIPAGGCRGFAVSPQSCIPRSQNPRRGMYKAWPSLRYPASPEARTRAGGCSRLGCLSAALHPPKPEASPRDAHAWLSLRRATSPKARSPAGGCTPSPNSPPPPHKKKAPPRSLPAAQQRLSLLRIKPSLTRAFSRSPLSQPPGLPAPAWRASPVRPGNRSPSFSHSDNPAQASDSHGSLILPL